MTDPRAMAQRKLPWVLVVDDNEANRYAVGRILRTAGFETSEASNGRQALELARTNPDVIVLDVNLPDVDGYEVVRELRASPATAMIPILHLSASFMRDEDRVFGLDNGANAYLTHPIEPTVFIATIRSLLRMRRLEEERAAATAEWQATFDAISDPVFVIDRSGTITRANRAAASTLIRRGASIVGKPWVGTMVAAYAGLEAARPGNTTGDIGAAIQRVAEAERTSVVRDFVGHGVGMLFHDEPNIMHFGVPGTGVELKPGMIFTIEPMINLGRPHVKILSDGWTAVTRDRTLSAQAEHSIGITDTGHEIFTLSPAGLFNPLRPGEQAE